MTETYSLDPAVSAVGSEILVEQRHALSAIAAVAKSFAIARPTDAPGRGLLFELVQTAGQCLPLAQHAAVTGMHDGMELLVGAGDPVMDGWLRAERALGHGPMHDVLTGSDSVVISDELHADPRWPELPEMFDQPISVHSLLAVGLSHRGSRTALALCSTWPFAFDNNARQYAELLVAIYALAERATA